jgi:DNA-binding MltR family transcriptional regulator
MPAKSSKRLSYSELANKFSKIPGIPKDKELIDIDKLKKLEKDKERIGVINWDTAFDQILKEILCVHFSRENKNVTKLFEPAIGGPLVSLTHKARLLYAMGLIDSEALKDLEHIHKIRNEFAHSVETDFSDAKVLKHMKNLSTSKGHKVSCP